LGLDLDGGFVLRIGTTYYHGTEAIHRPALLTTRNGVFNLLNYWISGRERFPGSCIQCSDQAETCFLLSWEESGLAKENLKHKTRGSTCISCLGPQV
jgi:hypothetical protein